MTGMRPLPQVPAPLRHYLAPVALPRDWELRNLMAEVGMDATRPWVRITSDGPIDQADNGLKVTLYGAICRSYLEPLAPSRAKSPTNGFRTFPSKSYRSSAARLVATKKSTMRRAAWKNRGTGGEFLISDF